MTFDEWLAYGMAQDWCGPAVCNTHDGTPMSDSEFDQFDDGDDPCIHIIRLYGDLEAKRAVEASHSPSVWRKNSLG
jgi:hypothetical protein